MLKTQALQPTKPAPWQAPVVLPAPVYSEMMEYGQTLRQALMGRYDKSSEYYNTEWSQKHVGYEFQFTTADRDAYHLGECVEAGCEPYQTQIVRQHMTLLLPFEIEGAWEEIAERHRLHFVRGDLEITYPHCVISPEGDDFF